METVEATATKLGISKADYLTVLKVVSNSDTPTFNGILWVLQKRLKNMNANHYLLIGYVMGSILTTSTMWETISNNLQPCQRQN